MSEAVPQPAVLPPRDFGTELVLVRHGQSADVVPGSPDSEDPPLSDLGHAQAQALAARLAPKSIDAVIASDLRRAVETAGYLAEPRHLPVEQRPDLQEVHLGDWGSGEFRRRAAVRDPEWQRFAAAGRWDLVPGSEGDDVFRHRVKRAVDEETARHAGKSIAIVVHGGVINAYLAETFGIERSFFASIENTSLTILRASGDRRLLVTVNDCTHLYDPALASAPAG
jgi:probable phosphoglycerate mutase